jgi:hypothetical protein
LVQFVEFKKYAGNATKLSEEVLEEVPRQVEEYFRLAKKVQSTAFGTTIIMN